MGWGGGEVEMCGGVRRLLRGRNKFRVAFETEQVCLGGGGDFVTER